MVFGSTELNQIPWETIVKVYRERLGRRSFDHLEDYAKHFLRFLDRRNTLFTSRDQQQAFMSCVLPYYHQIREDILRHWQAAAEKLADKTLSTRQAAAVVQRVIGNAWIEVRRKPRLRHLPASFARMVTRKYAREIVRARRWVFQELPLSRSLERKLTSIAVGLACRDFFHSGTSGVVVAGFGAGDAFPALCLYQVDCVVGNRLKYGKASGDRVTADNEALIRAFAQQEMVVTFMEGINPGCREVYSSCVKNVLLHLRDGVVRAMGGAQPSTKALQTFMSPRRVRRLLGEFEEKIESRIRRTQVGPVIDAVRALPKDELASMAEALVNLTSFKGRVSMEEETVGGPIDVAVISKGDGFVWIKRKHYFRPELNPRYFRGLPGRRS